MKWKFHLKYLLHEINQPLDFMLDHTLAMTVYFIGIGSIIAKLTEYYELPIAIANIITTLPALLTIIEFASNAFYKHLRLLAVIWRLALPATLLTAFFPKSIGAALMVIAFFLACTAYHLFMPSYNAWTVNTTQGKIRSNYFSIRDFIFLAVFSITNFILGLIVSHFEQQDNLPTAFMIVGYVLLVFCLGSFFYLFRKLPPIPKQTETKHGNFIKQVKLVLLDKPYRRVLLFNIIWNFFAQFSGFISTYQIRILEQSVLTVNSYNAIANIFRMALGLIFAHYASKLGWKKIICICLGIMFLDGICWMAITPENETALFFVACFLKELPWAGLGIGMFHYQINYTDLENRSVYFSVHAGLMGIFAFLGVISCNLIVSVVSVLPTTPYQVVFIPWILGIALTALFVIITPLTKPNPNEAKQPKIT